MSASGPPLPQKVECPRLFLGRVYHIYFQADDGQGGTCTGDVTVGVPHSQGKGVTAIDDGPAYDSTVP